MAEKIVLPEPFKNSDVSLEYAISARRSVRDFAGENLTIEEIGQLLWAAQGMTDAKRGFRASPSAGALYPMEIYLIKDDGQFHYLPETHEIERIKEEDLRGKLSKVALGQSSVAHAAVDIVIVAIYERVTSKYGERGKQYTHYEAGHIAQNIHLQAVSLGLASVPVGAFSDEGVKNVLGLSEDEVPLYIIPVGHGKF